ncbi:MFS transporter [Marinilactibacillus sp. GCM10026970]|uniref:MFS transporter n=1 Tax=Marinilactibacillus sp. GCM10026970 TaxID=3252642 RepID=UPI003606D9BF
MSDLNKFDKSIAIKLLSTNGLSSLGEWIYFIALNVSILSSGGNVLSVGILYIIRPVADIVTNALVSAHIDKFNKRKTMFALDLMNAILIGSLIFSQGIWSIYIVVFFVQVCSSMYVPISIGYTTLAIPKGHLKKYNSWDNLVNSGGFLVGPAISGLILSFSNVDVAILVNSVMLIIASLINLSLPHLMIEEEPSTEKTFFEINKESMVYLKTFFDTKRVYLIFYLLVSLLFVFAAGLNSVEAAFALEVVNLTEAEYGLIVSISGAGFVVGSIINTTVVGNTTIYRLINFGGVLYVLGYFLYSISHGFIVASIGFFMISFALAFINTGIRTFIQFAFPVNKIGQLTTALGTVSSALQMILVAVTSSLSLIYPMRLVLIAVEIIMFTMIIFIYAYGKKIRVSHPNI